MGWKRVRVGRPGVLTEVQPADSAEIKKTQEITAPHVVTRSPIVAQRRNRPTLEEQHAEALRDALDAEQSARDRREQIRTQVIAELQRHRATLPTTLDFLVDSRCGEDGVWRMHVSNNQWQIQRAIMFATAISARNSALLLNHMRRDDHNT